MGSGSSIFQTHDVALLKHIRFIDYDDFVRLRTFPIYPEHASLCQSISVFTPQLYQSALVVFISHVWLHNRFDQSIHAVDVIQAHKYDLCVEGIAKIRQNDAMKMKKCYLWMDCSCLNQQEIIPEERQILDKIIQFADCMFTPLYEAHSSVVRPKDAVLHSLQEGYPSPVWTGTATSYLNRSWCRLEMLCNALIPLVMDDIDEERCLRFKGKLAWHLKKGRRPHFVFGTFHAINNLPPEILPPLQCRWYDMLNPLNGYVTFDVDKEMIGRYMKALQPLVEDAILQEECYEGGWKDGMREGPGRIVCTSGDIYEGEFKRDAKQGLGKQHFLSGDVYEGDWKDDLMNGFGKLVKENGEVYEGDFFEGHCLGFAHVCYLNGDVYDGEMKGFQRHGVGKMAYGNKEAYEGMWRFNLRHGPGKVIKAGKVEEGMWRYDELCHNITPLSLVSSVMKYEGEKDEKGVFQGKGTCVWKDGTVFEGDWRDGIPHGHGTYKYPCGDVYIGGVQEGRRHGRGKCQYSDGKVYEGEWSQDFYHGRGKLHHVLTGEDYEGDFHYDAVHGLGHCKATEGSQYRGMWRFDMRHGHGKLQYANRDAYDGEWRYDQRHGIGSMAHAEGIVRGKWKDDVIIEEESKPIILVR